jgi:hypothetical protein
MRQIFCDETRSRQTSRRLAMNPNACTSHVECSSFRFCGKEASYDSGKHIAASGSCEAWRGVGVYSSEATRVGDHSVGTFQNDHGARACGGPAGALYF